MILRKVRTMHMLTEEDTQLVAVNTIGRKLTIGELAGLTQMLDGMFLDWYDVMTVAIEEVVKKGGDKT